MRLRGIQEAIEGKGIKWTVVISGNDSVQGAEVIAKALKEHRDIRIILGTGQADTEAAGRATVSGSPKIKCSGSTSSPFPIKTARSMLFSSSLTLPFH